MNEEKRRDELFGKRNELFDEASLLPLLGDSAYSKK